MRLIRSALVLGVIGGLVLCATDNAVTAQKGGKKGKLGKVTKLELKDGVGTMIVESQKKNDPDNIIKTTFKITKETKYFDAPKEKDDKPTPVKAEDVAAKLKEGAIVRVFAVDGNADAADRVIFEMRRKK